MKYLDLLHKLCSLSRNLNKSRETILEIREKKFRKLLKFAYNNSKFYHDYYSSHGITNSDLADISINELPAIDKKIFVQNFDLITTREELKLDKIKKFIEDEKDIEKKYMNEYTIVHTSGSTSAQTCFVYDHSAWQTVIVSTYRAIKGDLSIPQLAMKGLQGVKILYIAATNGRYGGVVATNDSIKGFGFTPMLLDIGTPLEQWAEKVNNFHPDIIIGYPSAIKILCDLICMGSVNVDIFRLITGGEPLTAQLRNYFESTLKTEAFNLYGCSESVSLGLERRDYNGIYLFDDINYITQEDGKTYVTPLYNFVQPLIKYTLTDKLKIQESNLNSKLPFTKIEKLLGRDEEIMWFTNEKGIDDFLHPLVIDVVEVEDIVYYQFIQLSKQDFEIHIVLRPNSDFKRIEAEITAIMTDVLHQKNLTNLKYKILKVDDISVNPTTGKRNIVIKKL